MSNGSFNYVALVGGGLLLMSSGLLYVSTQGMLAENAGMYHADGGTDWILYLFGARLCGIAAFLVGVYCLFRQQWTAGTILLLGSVGLPFVSLLVHGTM